MFRVTQEDRISLLGNRAVANLVPSLLYNAKMGLFPRVTRLQVEGRNITGDKTGLQSYWRRWDGFYSFKGGWG